MRTLILALTIVLAGNSFAGEAKRKTASNGAILNLSLSSDYIDNFGKISVKPNSDGTITFVRTNCGTYDEWLNSDCEKKEEESITTTLTEHHFGTDGYKLSFDKKSGYFLEFRFQDDRAFFKIEEPGTKGTTRIKKAIHLRLQLGT